MVFHFEDYLSALAVAATVLIIGYLKPGFLMDSDGKCVDYRLLALAAAAVGALVIFIQAGGLKSFDVV